jgi:hypothetical protein
MVRQHGLILRIGWYFIYPSELAQQHGYDAQLPVRSSRSTTARRNTCSS